MNEKYKSKDAPTSRRNAAIHKKLAELLNHAINSFSGIYYF